jgi:hypothetical protein
MTRLSVAIAAVAAGTALAAQAPKDAKPAPPTAAQLRSSSNNLKQIGLAVHNYHDANAALPNNVTSKDGKPLLSWRVLLLPYLEQDALYKEFKLDEAWDSSANKKLVEKMPKVYAPVRVKAEAGHTFYRGFAGPGTAFEPGKKLRFANFTDGLSNTALVVEAGEPVVWTRPDDLPYDPKKPLPKLGGLFDGRFHMLMGDGAVYPVRPDFDKDEFRKVVTRADGEVINLDAITVKK